MPYLLFLKKQQNLKLSSAANYRWRFKDEKYISDPGNPIDPRFYPERYFYVDGFTGVLYNNATLDLESSPLNENPNENLWSINLMVGLKNAQFFN